MARHITAPLTKDVTRSLRAGESITLSGTIYTARDAAHKRLCELVAAGKPLPFPIEGAVIYYVGPTPARPGEIIGSAGPTTSYRMDAYAPTLMRLGLLGMIGKGMRGQEVIDAMKETAQSILVPSAEQAPCSPAVSNQQNWYAMRTWARGHPPFGSGGYALTVVIDSLGNNLYETGRSAYLEQRQTL